MKTKASILCELAFMTNEYEALQLMANSRFWDECATEIANAIDRYCKCNNYTEVSSGSIKLYHKVAKGETLSKIAAEHKISLDKLIKLNKIKNPDKISVGQKLLLYQYKKYTVQKGDTLSEISLKFYKDVKYVDDIMVLNNLNSSVIYVNQVLKIPVL
jgi:LysM repeat protein